MLILQRFSGKAFRLNPGRNQFILVINTYDNYIR